MPKARAGSSGRLDADGLSAAARRVLPEDVRARVAEAWRGGRALILNANKPSYSEAFTIESEQYRLVRAAILSAIDALDSSGEPVLLKEVVAAVQDALGDHPSFPNGRMTNYARYVKTDLEARGEVERIPGRSPQRIQRARRR